MKAEKFYFKSPEVIKNAVARLLEIIPNGKVMMTLSDAGSKSSKQRGLQWIWYDEKAASGMGGKHEDTKEGVHLVAKYRFAVPILIRDDPDFSDLYDMWIAKYGQDQERMLWFVDKQVSTEVFTTSQTAEFLTCFQQDCTCNGIQLTDPQFKGLLD